MNSKITDKWKGSDGITYVNILIANTNQRSSGGRLLSQATPMKITQIRSDIIIDKPEDYYCAVARFNIPLYNTAFMIFSNYIQPNQANVNLTKFSFTLSYSGTDSSQTYVIFTPQLVRVPPPAGPVGSTPTQSDYYKIYDYRYFIEMMNTALSTAFTQLQGLVSPALNTANAPYFIYDASTRLISLMAEKAYYDWDVSPHVDIYFNGFLEDLLYAIPSESVSIDSLDGKDNRFYVRDFKNNTVTVSGDDYYQIQSEFIGLAYWNSLKSIVITSNTLPVQPEALPPTVTPYQNNNSLLDSSSLNTRIILQDFIPDLEEVGSFGSNAIYTPGFTDYRLVNLFSSRPLRELNIEIYYTDTFGNVYPILITPNQTATVKLAFIPKSFYQSRGNKLE